MISTYTKIRMFLVAATLTCFLITPAAATQDKKQTPKAEPVKTETVKAETPENAAMVNDSPISYQEYEKEIEVYQQRSAKTGKNMSEEQLSTLSGQILDQLINNELLLQQSKKEKVGVQAAEVQKEFDAIKNRNPDPAQFDALLKETRLTEDGLKKKLESNMTIRALLEDKVISKISIADPEAKSYYEENMQMFQQPEQVRARHILIGVDNAAGDEEKNKAREKLVAIKKRIDTGEDFEALAKEASTCPSSAQGGDLGYFSRERMVKPFSDAAFALQPNQVSDIVETQFGFHLIKQVDRRAAGATKYEDIKPRIVEFLKNQQVREKIDAYITSLRDHAKIEKFVK